MKVVRDPNQADGIAEYYDYNKSYGVPMRIPNEADFLAVYSTSPGEYYIIMMAVSYCILVLLKLNHI